MSDVLNRETLQYRRSVNTPDFPDPPWLEVPRGSANETLLRTVPTRYLVLTGDVLAEMDASAKAAVDAAALIVRRDSAVAQLEQQEDIIRAFMLIVLDEVNTLRVAAGLAERTETQLRTAIRNRLGS